ncbi:MAG: four-carbon acid sugar kinase family protein [Planctomycetota bacterium]
MHPGRNLPPNRQDTLSLLAGIREHCDRSNRTIVVLDDDPTGTQTVYDTRVLTVWDGSTIRQTLTQGDPLFFILTNSRALAEPDAVALATEIGATLRQSASEAGREVVVISRGDSTLRGHYPAEVDALSAALGTPNAVQVIMPFFLQGGRFTVNDVHYVVEREEEWTPVGETPFARDATFGFAASNLHQWVDEKRSAFDSRPTSSVSINDLRTSTIESLAEQLLSLPDRTVLIVNAVTIEDARTFALAAHHAMDRGRSFVYRTAASFVQAVAGLEEKPLLPGDRIINDDHAAGLIVVGSYVPKTTEQLDALLALDEPPEVVEVEVEALLASEQNQENAVRNAVDEIERHLRERRDVVLFTSRKLITGVDAESSLRIARQVSDSIVEIVRSLSSPLRYLIAKGGITSSEIATEALGIRTATVLGQILPGVPVWAFQRDQQDTTPYVVFPGNVGSRNALADAYQTLSANSPPQPRFR